MMKKSVNTKSYPQDKKLFQSNIWFKTVLEASVDGLHILDLEGNLIAWSPSFLEMLGYTETEAKALSVFDWDIHFSPEQIKHNMAKLHIGDAKELQSVHRSKDGKVFDVEISIKIFEIEGEKYLFATSRDITKRKEIENNILREKEKTQNYLDIVDVMILVLDKHKNVELINRKGCEILGYAYDEIIGKNFIEHFIPERFRPEITQVGDALLNPSLSPKELHENLILTKNGEERLIAWRNKPLCDEDGNHIGILTSGEDITDRRKREAELKSHQILLKTIINEMPDIFILKDEAGNFVLCNQTLANFYNTTPEAMIGKCDEDFGIPKEMSDSFKENVISVIKSGETQVVYENSIDANTGEIHHFRSTKKPITTENGNSNVIIIAQDLTPLMKAQEQIAQNEQRLSEVLEATHEAIWDWNIETGEVKHNTQWYTLLGFEETDLNDNINLFITQIYPDDKQKVIDRLQNVLEGVEERYASEHRMVRKDGEIMWVHDRGKIVQYNENGKPLRMVGSFSNITKRKTAENEIIRLSQVVSQNPYPTVITDVNGFIQYVNKVCLDISGYTEEELLYQKMSIFRSGHHDNSFYEKLWKTIKKDKTIWRGVLIDRIKDGTTKDCLSTIFPLFDENNKLTHFVSIKEDVTERNIKDRLFLMQTRQAQMGEMIAMIAHQWRQPLAIINAIVTRNIFHEALQEVENTALINDLQQIELQSLHLSQTISDFRNFFKPDKEMEVIFMDQIIDRALQLVDHSIKNHHITLSVENRCQYHVQTYANEVLQVIITLIKNSIDAFVERQTQNPTIHISLECEYEEGIISVADNAGGIAKEILEKIFLPYFTTKENKEGTGLGLYMTKMVIEEHCGGTILAETDHTTMTKFIIKLPLCKDPA